MSVQTMPDKVLAEAQAMRRRAGFRPCASAIHARR